MDHSSFTAAFLEDAHLQVLLIQESLEILGKNPADLIALANLRRGFHTLKSTAATMSLLPLSELCKAHEALLIPLLEQQSTISPEALAMMGDAVLFVEKELGKIKEAAAE
ncbi:MAG: Hpt domain-containing protein [Candidatus Peregrinibacteria bacterium]